MKDDHTSQAILAFYITSRERCELIMFEYLSDDNRSDGWFPSSGWLQGITLEMIEDRLELIKENGQLSDKEVKESLHAIIYERAQIRTKVLMKAFFLWAFELALILAIVFQKVAKKGTM